MSAGPTTRRRAPPPPPISPYTVLSGEDTLLSAEDYLRKIDSLENPPVKVVKPNNQSITYNKEVRIRYLQPPTPPPPGPIIIREKHLPPEPIQSPLIIRERKPEPQTPPPLTIRERPPTPPPLVEPCVVEKPIPPPPPPPRQIIIERLPTPPPKPRTVVFEKWLPYKKVKRPVLLEKAPPLPPVQPVRNVIIEYEPLKAYTIRRVIEEGVFRVDPQQYMHYESYINGDVRMVDRIDDLPPPSDSLMRVLHDYNPSHRYSPATSNMDQLTNVSRISNTPINRHDRVASPVFSSSAYSLTPIPVQQDKSKKSSQSPSKTSTIKSSSEST